jgi:hypothetical protein
MSTIDKDDVLIRWAYSEINSPEQGYLYRDVADLAGVPFSSLTLADRRRLLQQWHRARGGPTIFAEAFAGVTKFQCQEWTKRELGSIYILPHFKQWLPPADAVSNTNRHSHHTTKPN